MSPSTASEISSISGQEAGDPETLDFYSRYSLGKVLGRGASSVVRQCQEKNTKINYAVKIIDISGQSTDAFETEDMIKATRREVDILRRLSGHPNIIELHDFYESPTFFFLVFELCQRGELFDYLNQVVALSEKQTRRFMRQLLKVVEYMHSLNIVHRDLKPENILLDSDCNIKVTDFGFAAFLQTDHRDGENQLHDLCGTPGYLAPEVLKANMYENQPGYGRAVDLWACGVIMYTLLAGYPPFWNRRQMVMLRLIMAGDYNFETPEWQDVSNAPKELIKMLLQVDSSVRISATRALNHEFFTAFGTHLDEHVTPRQRFKRGITAVKCAVRIQRLHLTPQPISLIELQQDPYRMRHMRKLLDTCAFRVYGHWVKKGEQQNRAALFQNSIKIDEFMETGSSALKSVEVQ